MKNHVLLAACLLFSIIAHGQYFIYGDNGKPVTIQDMMNAKPADKEQERDNKNIFEKENTDDANAKYERMLWDLQQHTDVHGNIICEAKKWDEWQAYKNKNNYRNARTTGNASNWQYRGPDTPVSNGVGMGRINALAFHPTDPNTYWVGTAGGGAWKTNDNGVHWTAMTDNLPSLVVSDIAVNKQNPNTIYMCTGDRDYTILYHDVTRRIGGRFVSPSIGVLKSYNGGATWEPTGMSWKRSALQLTNSLLINPLDTNCLLLATSTGIYKSMDGGDTWKGKATGDFMQLLYKPGDTNVIYASTYADNYSATTSGQIYRSTDGGNSWVQISSFYQVVRIAMAVTPAAPNMLKAVTATSDTSNNNESLFGLEGVYSSSDMGNSFVKVYAGGCGHDLIGTYATIGYFVVGPGPNFHFNCDGQGSYDLVITIDPTNPNNVYIGGVDAVRSTDGGVSWVLLDQWNGTFGSAVPIVHGDKHVGSFHPLVPGRFFECNDGGVFYNDSVTSGGTTWINISRGLGITQFYGNAISENCLSVTAGAQDNGTLLMHPANTRPISVSGGDGMLCQQDPVDSTILYTSYVKGVLYRNTQLFTAGNITTTTISNNIPGIPQGDWTTPFVLEPACRTCILAGYNKLYRSTDTGNSWTAISPVFDTTKNISCIGTVATDANTIYAVSTGTNLIHASFDRGATWSTLTAESGYVWSIETDPRDKTHFWVSYTGYGPHRVEEYRPASGWRNTSDNLPDVPVNCLRLDTATRILYAGTDVGVFYKADTAVSWMLYSNALPVVRVTQLNISYTRKQLWASTFGRGVWMSPKAASIPSGIATVSSRNKATIYPNPNSGDFTFSVDMFYANKRVDMRLVDAMGRTVWSNAGRLDGNAKVQVQTKGLITGTYVFEAAVENEVIGREQIVIGR